MILDWLNGHSASGSGQPVHGERWQLIRLSYAADRLTAEFASASGSLTCVIEPSGSAGDRR